MPDQPDDPLHYEMKIPPEPKDAPLHKQEEHRGSDDGTAQSDKQRPGKKEGDSNPSPSSAE